MCWDREAILLMVDHGDETVRMLTENSRRSGSRWALELEDGEI